MRKWVDMFLEHMKVVHPDMYEEKTKGCKDVIEEIEKKWMPGLQDVLDKMNDEELVVAVIGTVMTYEKWKEVR